MIKPNLPLNIEPLIWVGPGDPAFDKSGLIHCVHIPKEAGPARPAPAVVMIHGWGGNESVMWIFKQSLPPGTVVVAPRAPYTLNQAEGFVWFDDHEGNRLQPALASLEAALAKLRQFLTSLPDLYPVEPERLLMMGFSQGAAMITTLLLAQPNMKNSLLGVALLAGARLELPHLRPAANILTGLPVFIAHGTEDTIIPLNTAQQVRALYFELGAEVTYREYPTGHKVNSQGMKDLKAWLARRLSNFGD